MNAGKKVFVGLSGGVDSSVSAALLKEQGFDVTGVFIKVWQPDFLPCNWKQERLDAMRVCAHLDIPFLFLDLEKEYKKEVIDYMIAEYQAGRTPNPDVMCNKYVKFGGFYDFARERGTDFIATGHYARTEASADGSVKLIAGEDKNKDQSYFLWTLPQEKLQRVIFPVGNIEKTEVRKLAKKFGLPTAEKKDSQGLCFVGKIDLEDFLSHFIKQKEGDVLGEGGAKIGTHPGTLFFTIGERHGFNVTEKSPSDAPLYVISKDMEKNTITVAPRRPAGLRGAEPHTLELRDTNWISGKAPEAGKPVAARCRYRQPLAECVLSYEAGKTTVNFKEPQQAVAPGQSCVIYDGDVCLGGGIIQ